MKPETFNTAKKLQEKIRGLEISLSYLGDDKFVHCNLGQYGLQQLCKSLWEDDFCMSTDKVNNFKFGIHGKVKENIEKYLKYKLEKYREELDSL